LARFGNPANRLILIGSRSELLYSIFHYSPIFHFSIIPLSPKIIVDCINSSVHDFLSGCGENSWIKIYDALRLLRLSALRSNLATNPKRVRIEPLRDAYFDSAMELLVQTFSNEQNIPGHLVPISKDKSPRWWCVRVGEEVIGAVAAWKESGQWHWGRFAVDKNLRGLGIGKSMAIESITELFTGAADKIIIDARDITVGIIEKLGGKQTRPPFDFYGEPVTPMVLEKDDFFARS
jgi:hypothetical protein